MANRPPSSCTIGLKSGGITGIASRTIHSGLFPDFSNDSITRKRLIIFNFFCPFDVANSSLKFLINCFVFKFSNSFFIAEAPISALNLSPCISFSSVYSTVDNS